MTVPSAVQRVKYTGNGSQTVFPIPFKFLEDSQIRAYRLLTGETESTLLTLGTHYNLTGAGEETGGDLTMTAALADQAILAITRELPITQLVDLKTQGRYSGETFEATFDRLVMIMQQLQGKVDLAVTADPTSEQGASVEYFLSLTERAESAAVGAESSETDAETAQTLAEAAQLAAETARNHAQAAEAGAESWADAAENTAALLHVKSYTATASAGQTVVNHNLDLDATAPTRTQVFIDGVKLPMAAYSLAANLITLDTPLVGSETIEIFSGVMLDGSSQSAAVSAAQAAASQLAAAASETNAAASAATAASLAATMPDPTGQTDKFLKSTGTGWSFAASASTAAWGAITGSMSDQTDLMNALNAKATSASPTLTGTPAAPTATEGTDTTQIATTAFANAAATAAAASKMPLVMPIVTHTSNGTLTKGSMNIIDGTALTMTMPTLADGEFVGIQPVQAGHTLNYDGTRSFWNIDGTTATSHTIAAGELGAGILQAWGTTKVGGLR